MASSLVEATWKWVVFPVPVLFSLEGICMDGLVTFECFSFPELGLVQPYLKKKCEKTNSVTVFIQNWGQFEFCSLRVSLEYFLAARYLLSSWSNIDTEQTLPAQKGHTQHEKRGIAIVCARYCVRAMHSTSGQGWKQRQESFQKWGQLEQTVGDRRARSWRTGESDRAVGSWCNTCGTLARFLTGSQCNSNALATLDGSQALLHLLLAYLGAFVHLPNSAFTLCPSCPLHTFQTAPLRKGFPSPSFLMLLLHVHFMSVRLVILFLIICFKHFHVPLWWNCKFSDIMDHRSSTVLAHA